MCPPPTGWHWRADAGAQFPLLSVFNGYVGPIEVVLNVQRAGSNCGNVNFRARLDTTILASGSSSFANAPPPPYSHQVTLWAVDPLPNNTISAVGSTVTFEFQHDDGDWTYLGSAAPSAWWVVNNVNQAILPSALPETSQGKRYDLAVKKVVSYARGTNSIASAAASGASGVALDLVYNPGLNGYPPHPLASYAELQAVCSGNSRLLQHLLSVAGFPSTVKWTWGGSSPATIEFYNSGGCIRFDQDAYEGARADPVFSYHALVLAGGQYFDPSYGEPAAPPVLEVCMPYSLFDENGIIVAECNPSTPQYTPRQQWGTESGYADAWNTDRRLIPCDGLTPPP